MNQQRPGRTVLPDGAKIRELRQARGWDAQELAEKAHSTMRTVINLEQGRACYVFTLANIATALGCAPGDLLLKPGPQAEEVKQEERRIQVRINVDIPFPDFDACIDLEKLIKLLEIVIGARASITPIKVAEGSTLITVEMSISDALRLVAVAVDNEQELISLLSIVRIEIGWRDWRKITDYPRLVRLLDEESIAAAISPDPEGPATKASTVSQLGKAGPEG